jgi:hypothetical protein
MADAAPQVATERELTIRADAATARLGAARA